MGGVFMYKYFRNFLICAWIAGLIGLWGLLSDRQALRDGLIRFHVVANSDSTEDQQIKRKVRDAVLDSIRQDLEAIADISEARRYLSENISSIQQIVSETLRSNGCPESSNVTFCKERFHARYYDTFSLPAGVYDSLRIIIGEGKGKNWWCVSFPSLCLPATSAGFEETAAMAGFSNNLIRTLSGSEPCSIRFFVLDRLGELENMFCPG